MSFLTSPSICVACSPIALDTNPILGKTQSAWRKLTFLACGLWPSGVPRESETESTQEGGGKEALLISGPVWAVLPRMPAVMTTRCPCWQHRPGGQRSQLFCSSYAASSKQTWQNDIVCVCVCIKQVNVVGCLCKCRSHPCADYMEVNRQCCCLLFC